MGKRRGWSFTRRRRASQGRAEKSSTESKASGSSSDSSTSQEHADITTPAPPSSQARGALLGGSSEAIFQDSMPSVPDLRPGALQQSGHGAMADVACSPHAVRLSGMAEGFVRTRSQSGGSSKGEPKQSKRSISFFRPFAALTGSKPSLKPGDDAGSHRQINPRVAVLAHGESAFQRLGQSAQLSGNTALSISAARLFGASFPLLTDRGGRSSKDSSATPISYLSPIPGSPVVTALDSEPMSPSVEPEQEVFWSDTRIAQVQNTMRRIRLGYGLIQKVPGTFQMISGPFGTIPRDYEGFLHNERGWVIFELTRVVDIGSAMRKELGWIAEHNGGWKDMPTRLIILMSDSRKAKFLTVVEIDYGNPAQGRLPSVNVFINYPFKRRVGDRVIEEQVRSAVQQHAQTLIREQIKDRTFVLRDIKVDSNKHFIVEEGVTSLSHQETSGDTASIPGSSASCPTMKSATKMAQEHSVIYSLEAMSRVLRGISPDHQARTEARAAKFPIQEGLPITKLLGSLVSEDDDLQQTPLSSFPVSEEIGGARAFEVQKQIVAKLWGKFKQLGETGACGAQARHDKTEEGAESRGDEMLHKNKRVL